MNEPSRSSTLTNSTVSGNTSSGEGGGIANFAPLTITNSTISGNASGKKGGGIENFSTMTITSTTVSGNTAITGNGGGIHNFSNGTLTITNGTVNGNAAATGNGGGIDNRGALTLANSIIANSVSGGDCSNIGTLTSLGHNLSRDGSCSFTATGDLENVDPKVGPLQDNGGPTFTHALLFGSPAIDSGDDSVVGRPLFLTTDQRGAGFPRLRGAHVDIGAYEAAPPSDPPQTSPFTVTKTGDTNDGFCGVADCSLREAIGSGDSGDSINIPIGTYTLTLGTELLINKSLTINGTGSGDSIIQAAASSAAATSRVFNITSGNNVAISDVTIQHGNISASGGGILNNGTLALTNGTVSGNTAFYGGGIFNVGTLTLTNSTVSGNSGSDGAGIYNIGTLTLTNSSVSGNSAGGAAVGGINVNTLTQTNSPVSGDSLPSAPSGGGIWNCNGCTVNFINTIIAGNNATVAGIDCFGTLTSQGHNLVQDVAGCTITGDLTGNITGQDPLLGPLKDNGGPTFTRALLAGSPAIDVGDDSVVGSPLFLTTDQRGTGFPRLRGAHVDIGAYEAVPPDLAIPLTGDWNLVSLPIVGPQNVPVADVVASLGSNLTRVYCYDATKPANPWGVYDPAAPPFAQSLFNIKPEEGCWFLMVTGDTLVLQGAGLPVDRTSWSLVNGWQLVGWGVEATGDPAAIATALGGTVRIYVYDAANPANPWKVYDSTAPPFVQTLSELVRGFGYWIYYVKPVVVAGDVNGDGKTDFIVGASGADPGGRSAAGSAYVYSGADGSLLYQRDGGAAGDNFGYSVSTAGDVNGDGKADFIVGAHSADPGGRGSAGSAYVYSGADGSLLYQRDGGSAGDEFGYSVSTAGDVNGDGKADFIVGGLYADPSGRADAGSAYVYSGADGSLLYQKDGGAASDRLGVSVSTAGDVNGDGKTDFIVGAHAADPGGRSAAGSAYVYSGAGGVLFYQRDGGAAGDQFGYSVSAAGDVNGDGKADFIVGATRADPGDRADAGSAYVYSGAEGSILHQRDGETAGDQFGTSVGGAK